MVVLVFFEGEEKFLNDLILLILKIYIYIIYIVGEGFVE